MRSAAQRREDRVRTVSTTYAAQLALRDKVELAVKMATTYLRKASGALYWTTADRATKVRPIPSDYWALLDQALDTAADIIDALPEDFFEDRPLGDPLGINEELGFSSDELFNMSDGPLERAEKVIAAIRARRERTVALRRILALERTDGRTEDEAAAYRAKAADLRRQHGVEER